MITHMRAIMQTSKGNFELELFPESAPKSVANFVNLAKSGFYDNVLFHRIIRGFVIQGGDPTTKNGEGSSFTWGQNNGPVNLPLEIDRNLHNTTGTIALANSGGPNSSGSQFFVNLADNLFLDGNYTVFGKVVNGMEVVQAISTISPVNPSSGTPMDTSAYVYIKKIEIIQNKQ